MLILRGSPALSQFRLQKLLESIVAAGITAQAISAQFVHVIEATGDLSPAEQKVLEQLLTYGPSRASVEVEGVQQIVAPRPGTISTWSSKATDIAHICGLAQVKRIERVVAYTIDVGGVATKFPFSVLRQEQLQLLGSKLHDRMTQVVFGDLAACETL